MRSSGSELLTLALIVAGCTGPKPPDASSIAKELDCPAGWTAQSNLDASIALCAPPGFTLTWNASDHAAWTRNDAASGAITMLAVDLHRPDADTLDGTWPRQLAGRAGCGAECWTVDTLVRMQDTVRGRAAQVEQGLVRGGQARFDRQPVFVASWEPAPGWHAEAHGAAPSMPTLDTLRAMLRTARVSTASR